MPDIILAFVAIGLAALYLREYVLRQRLLRNQRKNIEESEQKSYQIVHDATIRAQEIVKQAEMESVRMVADSKQGFLQNQLKYEQQFNEVVQRLGQAAEADLESSKERLKKSEDLFNHYLSDLEVKLNQADQSTQNYLKASTDDLIKGLRESVSSTISENQQRGLNAVEEDLKQARQTIKDYQDQRIKAVNNNLIVILEKTLNLVLTKKISLQDHVDLVYEAFEKAKEENVIV